MFYGGENPQNAQLTPEQRARLGLARRDLDEARVADLATMDTPSLVMLVERLRGSLHDTLQLVEEIAE